jgi:hypothetical protein
MANNTHNTDKATDADKEARIRSKLEVNNTLILSIAALAITWCSYQGTLWDGIQDFKLADCNKFSRLAQQKVIAVNQNRTIDEAIITSFVDAVIEKKQGRVDYILHGIRPELSTIMSAWLKLEPGKNPAAPLHPMAMPEYLALTDKGLEESRQLDNKADLYWNQAQTANTNSDNYSLLTVIFSMIMFIGAITTKLSHIRLSFTLIVVSGFICIAILALLFFYMPLATE